MMEGDLPGEKAHQEMVPGKRISAYEAIKQNLSFRSSAVSIILSPFGDSFQGILIKRTSYDGAHSGQIAFPGGKKDPEDLDLMATAIRETKEEISLHLSQNQLLGALTPVYIPVSRFMVQPYLFLVEELPDLVKEEKEVAEIITYDALEFVNKSSVEYTSIQLARGTTMKDVPFFNIQNQVVWGATALMLNELRTLFREVK